MTAHRARLDPAPAAGCGPRAPGSKSASRASEGSPLLKPVARSLKPFAPRLSSASAPAARPTPSLRSPRLVGAAAAAALTLAACVGPRVVPSARPSVPSSARAPAATEEPAPVEADSLPPDAAPDTPGSADAPPQPPAELGPQANTSGVAMAEEGARVPWREAILAAARRLLGTHPPLDCSGYVLAAYRAAGFSVNLQPAEKRSVGLLAAGRPVDVPRPGDLAFFRDTYDRNRNGRADDGVTHVALVEAVEGDRVTLLHRGRRVERIHMDLSDPSARTANDPVRVRRRRDRPGTRYLAGELFVGYAAFLDGAVTQTLQAGRADDTRADHTSRRWSRTASAGSSSERRAASRSTRRRAPSPSTRAACGGSCPSTRASSSRSSASAARGARSSPAR